jgi:phosphoribosylaminoimidazolecarboxamide formyltransferase/IMP cyclohydrolase
LHPRVHGGLLGRRGTDDAVMQEHGIEPIDLLVVNLYPFAATIARPDCSYAGGDREHRHRRPRDAACRGEESRRRHGAGRSGRLRHVLAQIDATGSTSIDTRSRLAAKAFAHTAQYDTVIASYLQQRLGDEEEDFGQHSLRCISTSSRTCAMARIRISARPSTAIPRAPVVR